MTQILLKALGALSIVTLVACGDSASSSSNLETESDAKLDTLITSDTLVTGGDTIINGTDTIITPTDTLITSDTTITPSVSSSITMSSGISSIGTNTSSSIATTNSTPAVNTSSSSVGSSNGSSGVFTERDLQQTADLTAATYITLVSGQDVILSTEGVYVISGTATDVSIIVQADTAAKVQIVLNGVSITNQDAPAVYVKSADKVFITTAANTDNTMKVSGAFVADGTTNLDAVIFSKEDLTLNGTGNLEIISTQGNGITSKDDLKITGGTIDITAAGHGLEANDSISISGGDITIDSGADGIHSENDEDTTLGSVYISGGTLDITATDDGIRATTILQVEGGTINIASKEGMESTYILINDGSVTISTNDDGLNASNKTTAYDVLIEVNGGTINVTVQGGDVDGFDANGDIEINGGIINVTCPTQAPSGAFDADGTATLNGGTVTVNGTVVTTLGSSGPGGRG